MSRSQSLYVHNLVYWRARFDSSVGRGDFKTAIGVGKVIKGVFALKVGAGRLR